MLSAVVWIGHNELGKVDQGQKEDNNVFGMSGWRKKNVFIWKNEQQ